MRTAPHLAEVVSWGSLREGCGSYKDQQTANKGVRSHILSRYIFRILLNALSTHCGIGESAIMPGVDSVDFFTVETELALSFGTREGLTREHHLRGKTSWRSDG